MTELGQTNDPKQLVPGNVAAMQGTALSLSTYGDNLHDAGAGLARIDTSEGWSGDAANKFRGVFHGQPGKWTEAGDAFHSAAAALATYSSALSWAQQQAGDAIRLWQDGQAATAAAKTQYDQAVQRARELTAAGTPTTPGPFVDPGASKRAAAQDMLSHARSQLDSAGNTAADAIARARDKAPPKPGFWDKVGDFFGGIGNDLRQGGEDLLNAGASLGNAMIHHPGDVLMAAFGAAVTTVSAAGDGVGTVLDVTVAGAVIGVPVNVVSTAGVATGVSMMAMSAGDLGSHAAGDDRVSAIQHDSPPEIGSGEPPANTPAHGEPGSLSDLNEQQLRNYNRYTQKLPSKAEPVQVENLPDGSVRLSAKVPANNIPGSYAEYIKVVDQNGNTVEYVKDTYGPDGTLIHSKIK